jgi:hypothetical protein
LIRSICCSPDVCALIAHVEVWTGKNIPEEFLQDLKHHKEEKAQLEAMAREVEGWPDDDLYDWSSFFVDCLLLFVHI